MVSAEISKDFPNNFKVEEEAVWKKFHNSQDGSRWLNTKGFHIINY